jgi:hypothetical protein
MELILGLSITTFIAVVAIDTLQYRRQKLHGNQLLTKR